MLFIVLAMLRGDTRPDKSYLEDKLLLPKPRRRKEVKAKDGVSLSKGVSGKKGMFAGVTDKTVRESESFKEREE